VRNSRPANDWRVINDGGTVYYGSPERLAALRAGEPVVVR
jgi:hypothetical protein